MGLEVLFCGDPFIAAALEKQMPEGPNLGLPSTTLSHGVRFPNESTQYRTARDELLRQEIELRRQSERVVAQRRTLPPGGAIKEDYLFNQGTKDEVSLSKLFGDKPTLITYSLMFGPKRPEPCPSCTALLDGFDGASRHITQHASFVVIAKSPIERIRSKAREREWTHLRFASSAGTTFNKDYFAEDNEGGEWPVLNVFTRDGDTVRHFYAAEMMFTKPDPGQDFRHLGPLDQLWNMLDFTPGGRGTDWRPHLDYADSGKHAA